ncbi:MAG: arginine N-succinyltransferase, partial [Sphingomonadaceae bacterium]|nr:arginine N-succinyltransferase [Sphingomonadaceae bacterium]
RLAWSAESFARDIGAPDNEYYMLFLEDSATGRIGGTACLFSRVGVDWPFYSYKLGMVTQTSRELKRSFAMQTLYLVNDYDGASEVGGLFLHPELRVAGLGRMLARSRYLFMAQHRERFGDRVLAELRGCIDDQGGSAFWDGLGAKFFGLPFHEADSFNSLNGNQFIAELMPKHPIYVSMLPDAARAVIGHPHPSGVPAKKLLESEGFAFDGYVDIFDGGPTMCARVDQVRTVRDSRTAMVAAVAGSGDALAPALLASGQLTDFRAWAGNIASGESGVIIAADDSRVHGLQIGDRVRHAPA